MDHALTLRIPDTIYQAAKNIAARRGMSLNKLVQEAITEKAAQSMENRLKRAYDLLATDSSGEGIEEAFLLQAEALLDG